MERKRRPEISVLNVIFCFLVIFIHIISYAVSGTPSGTASNTVALLSWRLSSFVVPGFILLSGVKLFLTGKDTLPYHTYIFGRVRGVILPYLVAFSVYYVCFVLVYDYPWSIGFVGKHFVLGSLVYHLYFIPILFQFDLLFPVWKRVVNKCSPMLILPFALLLSRLCEDSLPDLLAAAFPNVQLVYNDRLFTTYIGYYIMGCYIGKHYDAFCEMLKTHFRTVCIIFGFCAVMTGYFSYLAFGGIRAVAAMNAVHMLYVLAAILFLYALCLKLREGALDKLPLIKKVDSASFYIYLYHVLVLFWVDALLRAAHIETAGIAFIVRAVILYTVTPAACILYLLIKKKLKRK